MDDMENKGQGMVTNTGRDGSSIYTKVRERNTGDSKSRDGGGKETFEARIQESPSNAG